MRRDDRQFAAADSSFLLSGDTPRLIDEWQDLPEIWDIVREEVDTRAHPGQFILTGSSSPPPGRVRHSGAGRIARIKMSCMTLFESGDSNGAARLKNVLDNSFTYAESADVSLADIAHLIVRSGFPEVVSGGKNSTEVLPLYLTAIIGQMADISPFESGRMQRLLTSLARNECTPASMATLARDTGLGESIISVPTVDKYLSLLRLLHITDDIPPFVFGLRSSARVLAAPKRRLFDPAITALLLGTLYPETLLRDERTMGLLFESLVLRDLKVYAQCLGKELKHYRNSRGDEIDAVISDQSGDGWAGFEIKMNRERIDDAAEKLIKIVKRIPEGNKPPSALGVIVATGKRAYRRTDGVYVLPICAMRD